MNIKDRINKKTLNTKNIKAELQKQGYNQFDLAAYYITGFKGIGKPIKSDLRSNDKNNSLHVKVGKFGDLIVSDFGLKIGMTIFGYISYKYYGETTKDYIKGLDLIRRNFNLKNIIPANIGKHSITTTEVPKKHKIEIKTNNLSVKLEVKRQRIKGKIYWSKEDIAYWQQYGITTAKLDEKGIAPLSVFWITNYSKSGERIRFDVSKELCYVYPFFRDEFGHFMYKIYLPKGYKGDLNFKWISNVNKKVVQNIENIPDSGDLLIIQSSYKDILTMEILNKDLNIIAPNGEGIWFNNKVWNRLRKNWKNILLFANNDFEKKNNPGLKFARKHSLKYNIPFVCTPNGSTSDISDFYKKYGEEKTQKLLINVLNKSNLIL